MSETIMAVISIGVLLASLGMLWHSILRKEEIVSEEAWDRLVKRARNIKPIFALGFLSLVIYLFAESAELLNLYSPSATLESLHEIGELVHMLIAAVAIAIASLLFYTMLGGEDAL